MDNKTVQCQCCTRPLDESGQCGEGCNDGLGVIFNYVPDDEI